MACKDTTENYSCTWFMPNGNNKTYRIQATAVDSSGNQSSDAIYISSESGSSGGGGKPGNGGGGDDKPCRGSKCP